MRDAFNFDDADLDKLRDKIEKLAKQGIPIASKTMLNRMAFQARAYAQDEIKKKMITRNAWTERSVQVDMARGLNMRTQAATVGSVQPYMAVQEFGGSEAASGKHGVAIPTTEATGEGKGARPRKRLPRRAYRMGNIRLKKKGGRGPNKRARIIDKMMQTAKSGRRLLFLDLGRSKGIFRVTGSVRIKKGGHRSNLKLRMIYDLSRRSVRINKRPWLHPAVNRAAKDGPAFAKEALIFQAKRLGLR